MVTIPSEIAQIIEQKRQSMEAARAEKEAQEKRANDELIQKGKAIWDKYAEESLQKVPEWLRDWYAGPHENVNFERLAHGWNTPQNYELDFKIPGLPRVMFSEYSGKWAVPSAEYGEYEKSEGFKPDWNWNTQNWFDDLETALVQAQEEAVKMEGFQAEWAKDQQKKTERQQARTQEQAEQESQSESYQQAEKREEELLFDILRDDPVALAMLKAFVLIRQERTGLEAQIENANESMYSMENYWSGRAEELRRQANDAQRRADDERYRADGLQSDLDDTEKKLKRVERGW